MNALELDRLSVSYDGGKPAVDDLSLSVGQGEIVGIVGESGSGKSTLLHAITNLLPAGARVSGELRVFESCGAARAGQDVGMIFQNAARYMNPTATVGRQFRQMVHAWSRDELYPGPTVEMLGRMHLKQPEKLLRKYPFELSGGMAQRVAIAMALLGQPKLLLADEPTSALDVTVQEQVLALLAELNRTMGMTIVLVTHNLAAAAILCHHVGVMRAGRLVEWGASHDIVTQPKDDYTRQLLRAVPRL